METIDILTDVARLTRLLPHRYLRWLAVAEIKGPDYSTASTTMHLCIIDQATGSSTEDEIK